MPRQLRPGEVELLNDAGQPRYMTLPPCTCAAFMYQGWRNPSSEPPVPGAHHFSGCALWDQDLCLRWEAFQRGESYETYNPVVNRVPQVDPEFERLLMEEEAIERATRTTGVIDARTGDERPTDWYAAEIVGAVCEVLSGTNIYAAPWTWHPANTGPTPFLALIHRGPNAFDRCYLDADAGHMLDVATAEIAGNTERVLMRRLTAQCRTFGRLATASPANQVFVGPNTRRVRNFENIIQGARDRFHLRHPDGGPL